MKNTMTAIDYPAYKITFIFLILLFFCIDSSANELSKLKKITETLAPGTWIEIPDTKIPLITQKELHLIEKKNDSADFWGIQGPKTVLTAWSGAAFDGRRWWFSGGGHNAYGGNEVYQFDFQSLTWEMLIPPSPLTKPEKIKNKQCYVPENGPFAMHTYDSLTWNPVSKSVWFLRTDGIAYCKKAYFKKQDLPFWEFKPDTREWISHDSQNINTGRLISAWNPASNKIVVIPRGHGAKSKGPFEIDEKASIHRRGNIKFGINTGNMVYNSNDQTMYATSKTGLKRLPLSNKLLGNFEQVANFPQEMIDAGVQEGGMAYARDINQLVFWTGQRQTWSWDFSKKVFRRYLNDTSPTSPDGNKLIFSKWIYLPDISAFAGVTSSNSGVWIYKSGGSSEILDPNKPRACINDNCSFTSIKVALSSAKDGDTIKILAGKWQEGGVIKANNLTITGEDKAILSQATKNKAALVIKGNNTTIKNLECMGIKVQHGNGACIRLAGENLTLSNVYFHHNQQGILTGKDAGTIIIEDSRIENNGKDAHPTGRSHGAYINGDTLKIVRSTITGTLNEGHEVKSRARKTIIEDSFIASLDGNDSRLIDIPNGGELIVKNSILQQSKDSKNDQLIGFGWERGIRGPTWEENKILIENNTIIIDANNHKLLGIKDNFITPEISNNIIIGGKETYNNNCHYKDKNSANMTEFPILPKDKKTCNDAH